ncbi:MAG TPA: carboxypeptidase-like regulatory domain-containing protein [Chitinophagales bacterium]|nr:carboxypeptidase-like regulatory domain-containing protein [Chitinophagales bacterium]
MKTVVLAALAMGFFPAVALAQNGFISGRIISETDNKALSFVHVFANEKNATQTDENGRFPLSGLVRGNYQVKIKFIGFEDYSVDNIIIEEDGQHIQLPDIRLKEKTIRINEVMIMEHRTGYDDRYGSTNHIVTKKQLELIVPVGTEEALKTVPGVNVAGDMGISNRLNVGIRGSYPRRSDKILILEDGTPVAPAPYLAPSAYYNPPSERLDGIEVIKGAEVLTYGPNNIYGAINYITRRPPPSPTITANFTGGSQRYLSGLLSYGGTWNNVGAELQILGKNFDGYTQNSQSKIFNTTAKVYADLGSKQSFYVKINYHTENSLATYSALTPLTFRLAPKQNPFDADELLTTRYGIDLVHNLALGSKVVLNSKVYASQFSRDWWRQNTSVIRASTARSYLGDDIYFSKYSYLEGQTFTDDDYVRVGKLSNGRESTKARNRLFNVGGLQETAKINWLTGEVKHQSEVAFRFHAEKFQNTEISNDSSRFARSGKIVLDETYRLYALSGHAKHSFNYKKLTVVPALRIEYIIMNAKDLLKISNDPNNTGDENYQRPENTFFEALPGISLNYRIIEKINSNWSVFSSLYKGYTPPTSEAGFLAVDEEGNVSKPVDFSDINIKPETSFDFEIGTRGSLKDNGFSGQVSYFRNDIRNFYAAGRQEAFESLANVLINGIETGASLNLHSLMKMKKHQFSISGTFSLLIGKIKSGTLTDSDILNVKHTPATKQELVDMINENPGGFNVYYKDVNGNDSLITTPLTVNDFGNISRLDIIFGEDGLDNIPPYIPDYLFSVSVNYSIKGVGVNLVYNRVGSQYTEYLNFVNESGEGAIGKLDAYHTLDATVSYSLKHCKNMTLDGLRLFVSGKNLFNDVYRASRLHRISSGIFPAGFVQVIGGIEFKF